MVGLQPKYSFSNVDIVGDVQYLHEFYSVYLKNERDIIIWLPPSYGNVDRRFPVLYMMDGQNLFDPNTSFIGQDWKVDETAYRLIKQNKIDEIIVVGVYNSKDRMEEYNYFEPTGKRFASFLIRELKPFIDENFRTIAKASKTGIMGSSLGGLFSFQLFWNFPKIFGKAACLSNSFWVNDGEVFNMINNITPDLNEKSKLYIDCGSEEKQLIDDYYKMTDALLAGKFKNSHNFYNYLDEGSRHTETDWAKRLHIPFTFLFGKSRLPNAL